MPPRKHVHVERRQVLTTCLNTYVQSVTVSIGLRLVQQRRIAIDYEPLLSRAQPGSEVADVRPRPGGKVQNAERQLMWQAVGDRLRQGRGACRRIGLLA